jgi:hypothetical protein
MSIVRSPKLVLRGRYLYRFSWSEETTYLFSESLFEGKQREVLRNPRLGMTLVAGVDPINFTAILPRYNVNPGGFET